jgi:hypothetical protein
MLVLTEHDESLSGQGMKRIPDDNFRCRNLGIMSPVPMKVEKTGPASAN